MLATRPFLFILVEVCANSEGTQMDVPPPIKLLLQMCLESAKKTLFILSALQDQTLLGTGIISIHFNVPLTPTPECFLPFDLESAVSAGLVITMASLVSPSLIENHMDFLGTLSSVLDQMIDRGNLVAANQKEELSQLESLCARLKASPTQANHSAFSQLQEGTLPETGTTPGPLDHDLNINVARSGLENDNGSNSSETWTGQLPETSERAGDMSPSQLLEAVDMLNGGNLLDWLDLPNGALEFGIEGDGQCPSG
jgi:proline utilization trans-activator